MTEQTTAIEQTAAQAPSFGDEISRFVDHIDSLKTTAPMMMFGIAATTLAASQQLDRFFTEEKIEATEEPDGGKNYLIPSEKLPAFRRLERRVEQTVLAQALVPRSFIVTLVSAYDAYLGGLLRVMYTRRPELLHASDKQLSYSQLVGFGSMDEARDFVVEKEIESILRESHTAQFTWLENKLSIQLRKGLDSWPAFVEVTERRNLFVHTGGLVSRQYLKVCADHKVQLPTECALGHRLEVTSKYFQQAGDVVFEIGVKLAHVLWRKLLPDERAEADSSLNSLGFELIQRGSYKLALDLLTFATDTLKAHSSEEMYLFFLINKAQALKWMGRADEASKTLSSVDWSAKAEKLKIAWAVLEDRFDDAAGLVRRIGKGGDLSSAVYKDWPLFKEFRKSEEFLAAYEDVFGEPFTKPTAIPERELQQLGEAGPENGRQAAGIISAIESGEWWPDSGDG